MRFITLFSGALVATTAANILLSSDAHAAPVIGAWEPNGWTQVGKACGDSDKYLVKLQKNSDSSKYGVYKLGNEVKDGWTGVKGVSLVKANRKLNSDCYCGYSGSDCTEPYTPN